MASDRLHHLTFQVGPARSWTTIEDQAFDIVAGYTGHDSVNARDRKKIEGWLDNADIRVTRLTDGDWMGHVEVSV